MILVAQVQVNINLAHVVSLCLFGSFTFFPRIV